MSRIRPPLTTSMTVPPDGFVLVLELLDGAPWRARTESALLGQDQAAFFVLFGEDEGFTSSPTDTTSLGSTSCLMESSRRG